MIVCVVIVNTISCHVDGDKGHTFIAETAPIDQLITQALIWYQNVTT
jgi:hypothetical protein